MKYNKFLL